jgi:4-hydroxy-2-oxoheptanedioate aldolase
MGYDCIWLDLEHHQKSTETTAALIRATRLGTADVLARPAKGEFMRLGRLLEAGAHGILYPRCDNAAEAREVVRWAKFAPLGERGVDSGNPDNHFGELDVATYVEQANAETFIVIQIESPDAVAHAGAIAAVDGVDAVFFGPGDFSVLSGLPGQTSHERVRKARAEVCEATRAAGKHFATLCFDPNDVKHCLDMGATFIAYGADRPLLKVAYSDLQATLGPLGFAFD